MGALVAPKGYSPLTTLLKADVTGTAAIRRPVHKLR